MKHRRSYSPRRRRNDIKKHAKRRAFERFDIELTNEHIAKMVKEIQGGKCRVIEKQTNRVTLFEIRLPSGDTAIAAYDKSRKLIVTFMEKKE